MDPLTLITLLAQAIGTTADTIQKIHDAIGIQNVTLDQLKALTTLVKPPAEALAEAEGVAAPIANAGQNG